MQAAINNPENKDVPMQIEGAGSQPPLPPRVTSRPLYHLEDRGLLEPLQRGAAATFRLRFSLMELLLNGKVIQH